MLLRIIEVADAQADEDIEIVLQTADELIRFRAEYFPSPLTAGLRSTLEWYFRQYPLSPEPEPDDKNLPEKLIKLGQYMGDRLLGEDHQLMKVRDIIEEVGYEQLTVQIESTRCKFFQEYWEALILPDAKYMLATVCKAFIRRFSAGDLSAYEAERHYELTAGAPAMAEVDGGEAEGTPASPLGILYVVAPMQNDQPDYSYKACVDLLGRGEALCCELWPAQNWSALRQRLSDSDRPVHILHYRGPVNSGEGRVQFCLGHEADKPEWVDLSALAEVLQQTKTALVSVDAEGYDDGADALGADRGLALVAQQAAAAGLTNILGSAAFTDPRTAAWCYQAIYDRLAAGLALSQAIVETRKWLQTQIESDFYHLKSIPFHCWSLPVHYGGQGVVFFEQPQQSFELTASPRYSEIRQRLLGFRSDYLPPQVIDSDNSVLLAILRRSHGDSAVGIVGPAGSGKSHAAHQAGFQLLQSRRAQFGFYFDCAAEFYRKRDVLQMIASILGGSPASTADRESTELERDVFAALKKTSCCFVFDDLLQPASTGWPDTGAAEIAEMQEFIAELLRHRQIVLLSGEATGDASHFCDTVTQHVVIAPLPSPAQRALAVEVLQRKKLEAQHFSAALALLPALRGQPFLIRKLLPQLACHPGDELATEVTARLEPADDKVAAYYTWQWQTLPEPRRRLLALLVDLPGVLLEMLMLVCDRQEQNAFAPVAQLFAYLGDSETSFSDLLEQWDLAGLLINHPHGRVVDPRFIAYLRAHQAALSEVDDEAGLWMSQIVCEGFRQLAQHLQSQPNQVINHNLLANRQLWGAQLERLWQAQDYEGFARSKAALGSILRQAQLDRELGAWSLRLLQRGDNTPTQDTPAPAIAAWFAVALHALGEEGAGEDSLFVEAADYWHAWLETEGAALADATAAGSEPTWPHNAGLFHQVVLYLQAFYRRGERWSTCLTVSEIAHRVYVANEAPLQIVHSLRSLAQCSFALGEQQRAEAYEADLLQTLSTAKLPPEFCNQIRIELISSNIGRGEVERSQGLLDELKAGDDASRLSAVLDQLQQAIVEKRKAPSAAADQTQ